MRMTVKLPSEDALYAILQNVLAETKVPGIGLSISTRSEALVLAAGTSALGTGAPLKTTSRFEMSCLMKFFISLIALDLVHAGTLHLDAPIAVFLPELEDDRSGKAMRITLRHLLSHTSGYRGLDITDMKVRWNYSWDRFVEHFSGSPPSFPAGSTFNYEHSEHVVLGEILRRVTGKTAGDLVLERIWNPLGIETGSARSDRNDPAYFVADHVFSAADEKFSPVAIPPFGPFWGSSLPDRTVALQDIARIASALLGNGFGEPANTLFSPSVLARLVPPVITLPQGVHSGRQSEQIPRSFGTGCAQYGDTLLGHNGSMLGQTCALRFDPQMSVAVAVGVNARSPFARDTALQRIWAAITNAPEPDRREPVNLIFRPEDMLGDFTFDQVSGHYVGSYLGEVGVTRDAGGLRFDAGPPGNRRTSFCILPAGKGGARRYKFESKFPVSAVFARDTASGGPALFLGVHAYKKIS